MRWIGCMNGREDGRENERVRERKRIEAKTVAMKAKEEVDATVCQQRTEAI
jgi:hypothetical protein